MSPRSLRYFYKAEPLTQHLHPDSARDARAAHFERLLAAKAESKPTSSDNDFKLEKMKDEDTDTAANESDDSDGPGNEEDLDDYAKGFLAEMDEDERKVARGDDMLCA